MLRAAALLPFLRGIHRFSTSGHPDARLASQARCLLRGLLVVTTTGLRYSRQGTLFPNRYFRTVHASLPAHSSSIREPLSSGTLSWTITHPQSLAHARSELDFRPVFSTQGLLYDASTTASLIVNHSHLLDGIAASGSRLSAVSSRFYPLMTSRQAGDDAFT